MVDFELTEEQLAMQKTAKDFAEKEIKPVAEERDRILDPKEIWPWDIYEKGNKLGFNKILIPRQYGGLGLTELDGCLIIEELSVADGGIGSSYFVHCAQSRMLEDTAGDEAKEEFLTACCNDPEERYFFAHTNTEHGTAGDLGPRDFRAGRSTGQKLTQVDFATVKILPPVERNEMTTVARQDGDMWVINGTKRFIVFGRQAKLYMVTAKTDPSLPDVMATDGFLVPAGTPGLSFGHVEDKMGLRLTENAEVILEDVRVPEKWRCNWMTSIMMRGMTLNTFTAAVAVGIARRAFEEAIAYAQSRYKGGCLIIHHQAVQRLLADMAINIKSARLLAWQSAWQNEKKSGFTVLANMAKVLAAEMCVDATTKGMEVFGGYGYMHDFPMEKLVRDAHVMPIYDATVEMLRHGIIVPRITEEGTA